MSDRPKENDRASVLRVVGIRTEDTESIRYKWPSLDLTTDDVVEMRVLSDGSGDPPAEVRRSSETTKTLFSSPKLAKKLVDLVTDFEAQIMNVVSESEVSEPDVEHEKVKAAAGDLFIEIGDRVLYPIYRRHKELVPPEMRGEFF